MRRTLAVETGDLTFQPRLLQQPRVTRCDGLGEGELVGGVADVVDGADRAITRQRCGDEPGLALVVLPHGGVHGAKGRVGVNFHLVVLVALPLDPPFPLLDVGRQPWHIQVGQRLQAKLGVDSRAHGLCRAEHEAHAAGVDVVEQALLLGRALEVLHDCDLGRWHTEADQLVLDPAVGREAARLLGRERAEVGEDHLRRPCRRERRAVPLAVALLARLLPDAVRVADQRVQLVVGLVTRPRFHQAHVDRGVAAVGDDLQQDVITLFHTACALLDLVDAGSQLRLVVAECVAGLCRDELAMTAFHGWQLQVAAQVVIQHDIRDRPEHVDQLGDVDEFAETLDRLVGAGRLQLQLRARVAEGARPGVELVDAALAQQALVLVANEREHLAHRVGDRRARGLDQRAARVDGLDEAALDVEVPRSLRTIRIDTLQCRAISRKS